jgi:hypothetical protein
MIVNVAVRGTLGYPAALRAEPGVLSTGLSSKSSGFRWVRATLRRS